MRIPSSAFLGLAASLVAGAASASTPAAWKAGEAQARRTCLAASGLKQARATSGVLFSDDLGRTALLVSGRWPQAHMKGRAGVMLCLFDRRTGRAEVAEAAGWSGPLR